MGRTAERTKLSAADYLAWQRAQETALDPATASCLTDGEMDPCHR